jgi:uncharacterized spore protein YtfJ
MTTVDLARESATKAVHGPGDALLERLAQLTGSRATVEAVFGKPITQGDITIIPVARVRWGFGGGSGRADEAPASPASGSGGGGGVMADPVGYLEIRPTGTHFKPIGGPSPLLIVAAALGLGLVLRAIGRVVGRA